MAFHDNISFSLISFSILYFICKFKISFFNILRIQFFQYTTIVKTKMNFISSNQGEIDIKKFKKVKRINKGGFGVVYTVEKRETGELYAAKIIDCNDTT